MQTAGHPFKRLLLLLVGDPSFWGRLGRRAGDSGGGSVIAVATETRPTRELRPGGEFGQTE